MVFGILVILYSNFAFGGYSAPKGRQAPTIQKSSCENCITRAKKFCRLPKVYGAGTPNNLGPVVRKVYKKLEQIDENLFIQFRLSSDRMVPDLIRNSCKGLKKLKALDEKADIKEICLYYFEQCKSLCPLTRLNQKKIDTSVGKLTNGAAVYRLFNRVNFEIEKRCERVNFDPLDDLLK